ncbi:hypothetical protein [Nocardia brasiliensis]|uniref:hypothetical protein n=1 Tax=Nocardia brasiliensis TaxID=37326 RepID=UPI002457CF12|nr:hypothetical protein [Nocardia brasiliensis]
MAMVGLVVGGGVAQLVNDSSFNSRINDFGDVGESFGRGAMSTLLGGAAARAVARWLWPVADRRVPESWEANGFLRGAIGGSSAANLPPTRWLMEQASAGLAGFGHWYGNLVPTQDIGAGVLLPGMPDQLLMPGPEILPGAIESDYHRVASILAAHWRSLGAEHQIGAPQPVVPAHVRGPENSGIGEYVELAERQTTDVARFRSADTGVAELVQHAATLADDAKKAIYDAIETLNRHAPMPPPPQFTAQADWTMHYLERALAAAGVAMENTVRGVAELGGNVEGVATGTYHAALRSGPHMPMEPQHDAVPAFPMLTV